ncbi:MAG: S8 family serine peptidase [Chloroflexi bacterium]|nr:S8 family serine peptidase [Chloroflexota bacterium]
MSLGSRFGRVLVFLLLVCLIITPLASAEYQPKPITDAEPEPSVPAAPAAPVVKPGPRLIVELEKAPLATWPDGDAVVMSVRGKLDAKSPEAQAYMQVLKADQDSFVRALARNPQLANSIRPATFQTEQGATRMLAFQAALNAVTVDVNGMDLAQAERVLLAMKGVKAVYREYAYTPALYASNPLINSQVIWNLVGGQARGGEGIKIASMDGGIHKDAPMFSGEGWSYPAGYPANGYGLTENNNGKIIVSRAYFRDWDPPAEGEGFAWPGPTGTSHGVHTAGIAGGNVVTASYAGMTFTNMSGVAPGAWVMSYKVFYDSVTGDGSFYTPEGIAALEDIILDGADVLNCSWGGGPTSIGGEGDALDTALRNVVAAGIFVAVSNGNAGPGYGTGDHPSSDYMNVAAQTTTGTLAIGQLIMSDADALSSYPVLNDIPASMADDWGAPLELGESELFDYVPAAAVAPGNALGCNPFPAGTFTGKTALIQRGGSSCGFGLKALNAQNAGAVAVIIFNHEDGGDTLINMGAGIYGGQVHIPVVFIYESDGNALSDWYADNSNSGEVVFGYTGYQVGNEPDIITYFSSRGPAVGNRLKPDIAAPGDNILSQGYTPGAVGEVRHLGYGQASGTSMAAPHVAGAAALLLQLHPDWTPAQLKSAMMSTARYVDIYDYDGTPAQPLDMGAGSLNLEGAMDPGVLLDPPSLSFGALGGLTGLVTKTIQVQVKSVATSTQIYAISTISYTDSFTSSMDMPGVTFDPAELALEPGQTGYISVTFDCTLAGSMGDFQGYLLLTSDDYSVHLPAWAQYGSTFPFDVLVIDNDASARPGSGEVDYVGYYTETLKALGLSSHVVDVDALVGDPEATLFLPRPDLLAGVPLIIWFTGDTWEADGHDIVPTPFTQWDKDVMANYLNQGGRLIVMGQNLAHTLNAGNDPGYFSGVMLYDFNLGAVYLQNTVTNEELPTQPFVAMPSAPKAYQNVSVYAGYVNQPYGETGAENQRFVDELYCLEPGPESPPLAYEYQSLLRYTATVNPWYQGIVAIYHRDQVSLDRRAISYLGRSIYTSFGLEGVVDPEDPVIDPDSPVDTRAELLKLLIDTLNDEPQGSISNVQAPYSYVNTFTYDYQSPVDSSVGVTYLWDFGDGTSRVRTSSNRVMHQFSGPGTYTVSCQVYSNYGNNHVADLTFTMQEVDEFRVYMPVVLK